MSSGGKFFFKSLMSHSVVIVGVCFYVSKKHNYVSVRRNLFFVECFWWQHFCLLNISIMTGLRLTASVDAFVPVGTILCHIDLPSITASLS